MANGKEGVGVAGCFAYPLDLTYGASILALAVCTAAVAAVSPNTEVARWITVLAIAWLGFGLIDRIAAGKPRGGFASSGLMRPLKYWVIVFAMDALVLRYARKYGYYAAIGIDIVMSLLWPIMIAQLAVTGKLRAAFNAVEWLRIANAAPMAYLVVAVLSVATDQLGYALGAVVYPESEGDVSTPNIGAAFAFEWLMTYLGVVNFCLVGWFCYAARDAMVPEGASSETLASAAPAAATAAARPAATSLDTQVREALARGQLAEAEKLAYDAMREDPYDAHKHAIYRQALMAQADTAKTLAHARRYMALLMKSAKQADAVKVFRESTALDPQFRPEADEVLALARAARAAKDPATAVAIVRGFDKANVGHPDVPQVYLFSAQLMAEDLGDREMARKILQHVLNRFPGHSIAPEAKAYLEGLGSVARA